MAVDFQVTKDHKRWASRACRKCKKKQFRDQQFWIDKIRKQKGKCALTGAPLLFNVKYGMARCHPLYASIDHVQPGSEENGLDIVCYDINDLKGHMPPFLFDALKKTNKWKSFSKKWQKEASRTKRRKVFEDIIKGK